MLERKYKAGSKYWGWKTYRQADDAWIKDRKRLKMINRYHNFDNLRFVSSIILPRILALKLRGFVESWSLITMHLPLLDSPRGCIWLMLGQLEEPDLDSLFTSRFAEAKCFILLSWLLSKRPLILRSYAFESKNGDWPISPEHLKLPTIAFETEGLLTPEEGFDQKLLLISSSFRDKYVGWAESGLDNSGFCSDSENEKVLIGEPSAAAPVDITTLEVEEDVKGRSSCCGPELSSSS